jgi:hypothetical protein
MHRIGQNKSGIDGKIGQNHGQNHPNKVESSIFKPRSSSPSTRNLQKAEV